MNTANKLTYYVDETRSINGYINYAIITKDLQGNVKSISISNNDAEVFKNIKSNGYTEITHIEENKIISYPLIYGYMGETKDADFNTREYTFLNPSTNKSMIYIILAMNRVNRPIK